MADEQNNFKKQKANYIQTVLNICWTWLSESLCFLLCNISKKK